ncbi:MAG: PAS domain-containing protein [Archangiaceae bacterium]|nr:PAS domain-containing protein [Archangiaceae bacterium]
MRALLDELEALLRETPSAPALALFDRLRESCARTEAHLIEAGNQLLERDAMQLVEAATRDLVQSERDAFFKTSCDLLCVLDDRLCFTQANPSWQTTLGHDPSRLLGTTLVKLIHPDDLERSHEMAARVMAELRVSEFELRVAASGGDWRWISWTATWDPERQRYFGIGRDVTEQRALAKEVAQAQKLEAIGQLAAGVAHEINTPVQFVGDNLVFITDAWRDTMGYLDALETALGSEQREALQLRAQAIDLDYLKREVPTSLSDGHDGLQRVAELVRALKEFSHQDGGSLEPADVNAIIQRSAVLSRGELKHLAELELRLEDVPRVPCLPNALGQVMLNLLVNAAHAIEERSARQRDCPRRIVVQTRVVGSDLAISVSDTGQGIPPAVQERIFEPFFTTKPMGKGTGQGLSLVRAVITQRHKGRISVESTVGQGTTFTLFIPLLATPGLSEAA